MEILPKVHKLNVKEEFNVGKGQKTKPNNFKIIKLIFNPI